MLSHFIPCRRLLAPALPTVPALPVPAQNSEQVLSSAISRGVSDSEPTEPESIYFLFPNPAPDWKGLWKHHHNAAKDPSRPPAARRWHADQCRRVKARETTQAPQAWDWRELCHAFGGFQSAGAGPLT